MSLTSSDLRSSTRKKFLPIPGGTHTRTQQTQVGRVSPQAAFLRLSLAFHQTKKKKKKKNSCCPRFSSLPPHSSLILGVLHCFAISVGLCVRLFSTSLGVCSYLLFTCSLVWFVFPAEFFSTEFLASPSAPLGSPDFLRLFSSFSEILPKFSASISSSAPPLS